ncbi:MAG TPA: PKD domain-containing protein [Terriglobales bacterium]|nr:PKD domain-containing protein [Terriglobales bacterium]
MSLTAPVWAGKAVIPNTTLAAESGNNTSGAPTFTTQTNGNIAPRNVSKVPVRNLLYSGSNTKMYAHFMPWFGGTNHMNVGYQSNEPAQVAKQVTDMLSRGIEGAIINWYGPNFARENNTSLAMMKDAETRSGQFTFAIMEDGGALKKCSTIVGCDVTQRMIDDLGYAYNTFEQSPAYMRVDGRPVVFFFGVEAYVIDWDRVRANVPGNPLFVQRNAGAFTKPQMNGGYGWIAPETVSLADPIGLGYIDYFYSKALEASSMMKYGSAYPGFDDRLAAWTQNRQIVQNCGQTWLATMERASKYYSAGNQLPFFQLVTWNDYEEGTEIETGIDSCVSVNAAVSGSMLNWSISGSESVLDHFTVYISADGVNLMPVMDVPASSRNLEMGSFGFNPAAYKVYVKAVAKSSLTNAISGGVDYMVANVTKVTISTPFNGATVTSPVRIAAVGESGYPVTAMQVYVDGVLAHQTNTSSLDVNLTMLSGARYVAVKAWDSSGANSVSAMTLNVLANKNPIAMLTVTPLAGGAPVTVTASANGSYDPDGSLASTTIDFGDGYIVNGSSGAHIYNSGGTYTVKLTVTDNTGASATSTQTVTVEAPTKFAVIHTPSANGKVSTQALVTATGYSTKGVRAMQVYVDGKLKYKVLGSSVNTYVDMTPGVHEILVKGWELSGGSFESAITVTAQ